MKHIFNLFKIPLCLTYILFFSFPLLAYEVDSTNYKLTGVTISGSGGIFKSTNFTLLSNTGQISMNPRNYSTSYRINQGPSEAFRAAQPTIRCFETDTDGSSTECISGPQELLNGGMIALCGGTGCYEKARFEIESSSNPSDTLFNVEISVDNFQSDIRCINASTFKPQSLSSCDISDFRTQGYWENEVFNIQGILPNTKYYIRITALHGDFTQSDYSIVADATTVFSYLFFDIDIATNTGYEADTSPPHSITFSGDTKLIPGASAVTATSLIWLDVDSNSSQGMAIILSGLNGGLYSPTTTETIISSNQNLDSSGAEGFGLQNYYINYQSSSFLGDISAMANYSGSGNTVGEVTTQPKKIYDGDGPISGGRMGIYLKTRVSSIRTPASDYSEHIYFVLTPRY